MSGSPEMILHLTVTETESDASGAAVLGLALSDKSSAVAEMGDRLTTIDMGRKIGGCCAPFRGGGSWVPI